MTTIYHNTPAPPTPNLLNDGVCDIWNGFFIALTLMSFALIGFLAFVIYRRDKSPTPGKMDWGLPWGIGVFLFSIGLWNLLPPNVFFALFKIIWPGFNELAPQMACLAVENYPIITCMLILLGIQIVFLYNPAAAAENTRPWYCDDSELAKVENPTVLLYGGLSRGRLLSERLEHRVKYEQDQSANKFIVPKTHVILFNSIPAKEREFISNNLECRGVNRSDLYEFVTPRQVSQDNVFKLPFEDNSVDKILWSPMIRGAAPIGTMMTSESVKAQKMSMMLDEAFRVLKPGGKFISVDAADRAILTWADLRDAVGAEHAELTENVNKMKITPMMAMKLHKVVGTKPEKFIPTGRMHITKDGDDKGHAAVKNAVDQQEMEQKLNDDGTSPYREDEKDTLSSGTVFALLCVVQLIIFFGLAFAAAALYVPLNLPTDIPLSQRAGNTLPSICTSYASVAFFEREILGGMPFRSIGSLLFMQIQASLISIIVSLLGTAVIAVPTTALQIGLHDAGIGATALSMIGMAISVTIGLIGYKLQQHKSKKSTLGCRKLDFDRYKQHF